MALKNSSGLLLLVSLGVVLGALFKLSGRTSDPVRSASDGTPAAAPSAALGGNSAAERRSADPPPKADTHPVPAEGSPKQSETPSSNVRGPEHETPSARLPSASSSPVLANAATDAVSVAGNPFLISESVEAGCKRESADCGDLLAFLERMAQEPRDPAWAGKMEEEIRAKVLSEPGKYSIRALECRKTMCALETESIFGIFTGFAYGTPLFRQLSEFDGAFGYERSRTGDGNRVTITLRTYNRK